jgi:hypothetical protein
VNELHLVKPSTVKMIKPIALLLTLFFSFYADAAVVPATSAPPKFDFTKIKAKDIERITGKKLTFFQKIKWKIAQVALKKIKGEITEKQKKQAELSMILGISSIGILLLSGAIPFIGLLCIPAAILAIIFGAKSLKGNSNTKGIVGVVTGGATLLLIVLAVILLAIFFAGGLGFE